MDEQKWRIEVGYNLEGDLTDVEAYNIAQQNLCRSLKQATIPSPKVNRGGGFLTVTYFGFPLWAIILMVLLGIFIPVFREGIGRRGGRSGGGGAGESW